MISQGQNQSLQQKQGLALSQQLQQSLKILQFSSQELNQYVEHEIEQNPFLEKDEFSGDDADNTIDDKADEGQVKDLCETSQSIELRDTKDAILAIDQSSWDNNGQSSGESLVNSQQNNNANISSSNIYDSKDKNFFLEQVLSNEITLKEHILGQINSGFFDAQQKIVAVTLTEYLTSSGYLEVDLRDIAKSLSCEVKYIREVLKKLQQLEPVGVFATSLAQCLELQLRQLGRFDPSMAKLVNNLDLLARNQVTRLRKICKVTSEDLQDMCAEIRSLNPRPASGFSDEVVQTINIDVFLQRNAEDEFSIELNSAVLPKVLANKQYYSNIKSKTKDKTQKKYIVEQMNHANWLVRAMHQRAETILKVTTEIVDQQKDFFIKGVYHLRPLVLADIAKKLGIHESTVGRVTRQKYISTSNGVYELKYFFSSAINNSICDDSYSSQSVKHMIKDLIAQETDAKSVLSDEKISIILKNKNIDIARRTVAKYRESLNISSSAQRKRAKKIAI